VNLLLKWGFIFWVFYVLKKAWAKKSHGRS